MSYSLHSSKVVLKTVKMGNYYLLGVFKTMAHMTDPCLEVCIMRIIIF